MSQNSQVSLALAERLDRTAAINLKAELDEHVGKDVEVDGSANQSLTGPALQVLVFAKRHWEESGWGFEITQPSEKLAQALAWFENTDNTEFGDN